ncbi:MAG: hypothetical protein KIH01_06835 [Candidatus Freyarchaeota archaeon]|nr:hypothetical protein [Candidatus Jordarchaeia archaeon]
MAWMGRFSYGRKWRFWQTPSNQQGAPTPQGYRYVGSCRCGFGPNAFYQDPQGRIDVSQLFWAPPSKPVKTEDESVELKISSLREKLDELAAEIDELSSEVKDSTSQHPSKWWPFRKQE